MRNAILLCARPSGLALRFARAAVLTTIGAVLLSGGAFAKVEREHGNAIRADEPAIEVGGNPVVSAGPFHLSCSQFGLNVVEVQRADRLAISPLSIIGALSFSRFGDRTRNIVLPLGDGVTTCVLAQEPRYLRPATAAVERAVAENRFATWQSLRDRAMGRAVPVRTFTDRNGRMCREFSQTITIDGRSEAGIGFACREADGTWNFVR
jgi:hypothetical protein